MKILNLSNNIGNNIKRLRLNKKFTQEQTVAKMQTLGSPISRSTYSLIELGRGNIYDSDLVCLKLIFDVPFEAFFENISTKRG